MMKNMGKDFLKTAALALTLCMALLAMSGTAFSQECVENENTLTDTQHNLMLWAWSSVDSSWEQCMEFVSSLRVDGYNDWRVPSNDDWYSLYPSPCKNRPPLSDGVFFWTSTVCDINTRNAYVINFKHAVISSETKKELNGCIAIRSLP